MQWDESRIRSLRMEIGQSYEEEAMDARDIRNSHMPEAFFLEEALKHYIEIGCMEKISELKVRIREAYCSSKDEYQALSYTIKVPMDVETQFLKPYEELDEKNCLALAGSDPRLVMTLGSVEQQAAQFKNSWPLLFQASKFVVDGDRKVFCADSEEASFKFVADHEYMQRVRLNAELFLKSLFRYLCRQRGMTADSLVGFLREWPLLDADNAFVIEVGVRRFFEEDYVSTLHVLVPQLEACVRRMFARAGIATTSIKQGTIQHEQTFNELLEREEVKEDLGTDFHKYLKMVMVDPLGLNLRNDIAHGLVKPSECNERNGLVVLHLFLILTRFRLQSN